MTRSLKPSRRTAVPPFLRIQINRELTERRFDQFESYALSLEGMLRRQATSMTIKVEAKLKNMPEEAKQDYIEAVAEDYAELQETFPIMFRTSLFVMCLADFEHTLNGLADLFQHAKKLELSFKEVRGEGMDRARIYLKKVARVGFPDDSPLWPQIKAFSALRNVLVHAGGRIPPDHKDRKVIQDLMRTHADKLRLDRFERIVLERGFVPHVLETLRIFHANYAAELKERYRISMFST